MLLLLLLSRSVVSDSLRPHGLQPTRPLCPWDSPGKSTGVGCHCLLRLSIRVIIYHSVYPMITITFPMLHFIVYRIPLIFFFLKWTSYLIRFFARSSEYYFVRVNSICESKHRAEVALELRGSFDSSQNL